MLEITKNEETLSTETRSKFLIENSVHVSKMGKYCMTSWGGGGNTWSY